MRENIEVVPLDSFSSVYKLLLWAGYFKLDQRVKTWKKIVHEIYRRLALIIIIVYYLQLLSYNFQSHQFDIEKMTESLILEILHTNLLCKYLTLFFLDTRLQKLNKFLKDGVFCSTNETDQKILQENGNQMYCLFRILNINAFAGALFWGFCSIIKRYIKEEYEVIPMYLPYRTDTGFRFSLLLLNQVGPMFWLANGHTSMDILIATYYAQAHTQLKIIRQQLNSLVEETQNDGDYLNYGFQYKDLTYKSIKERFISVVKRYEKLTWYVKEVDSIFDVPISFQFFSSAIGVCFVSYGLSIASTGFQVIFMIFVLFFLITQIFLYCIFGNFVFTESEFINYSLYESNWLSLSPSFRRMLLAAMVMWSKPLQPKVCRLLQLSLSTFLSIIKVSYRLYTVLIVITKN